EQPAPVRVVSEIIKEYIDALGPIWIEGELSQINSRKDFTYMVLRDSSVDMSISLACPSGVFNKNKVGENARIKIFAKPSWYTKNGSVSFWVREIKEIGVGELLARLEMLKNLLAAEGLFDAKWKKPLPLLPNKVGLICGRNSDAEKDVLENARRRWPAVQFEIREVQVQGADAVIQVSAALKELEADQDVDVIIITRGGGSFEDLLPFSDEGLVRLAASCKTPIVSAIGHEKDAPLLDLVADYRASTPTDAGKKVVPDLNEELAFIDALRTRAKRTLTMRLERESDRIKSLFDRRIAFVHRIKLAEEDLQHLLARVRALSPQSTLERGYAVVQRLDGKAVRSAKDVASG
ncbi:MAG: exodeoxyribonuclease VII large subunit, partial [Candidatus Nanopelagicaceae bacterium]